MKPAIGAGTRKERRTPAVLGGILAIGAISCAGFPVEPVEWSLEGTVYWNAPLYRDPAGGEPKARGRIGVRKQVFVGTQGGMVVQHEERWNLTLRIRGLRPGHSYALSSPLWTSPMILAADLAGRLDSGSGISISVPSPGDRVALGDPSGGTILAGVVPDWKDRPGGTGPVRDDFGPGPEGETVDLEIDRSTRTGNEHLEFRMAGLAPESAADLLLEDGGNGFVQVGSAAANRRGRAVLRWTSKGSDPLPLGAVTVAALEGRGFQVRVGTGTVLEGVIP